MLKKECHDVLKQIVFFTLVILLLPAFLIITTIIPNQSYFSVFFPIFQFGLLFWAFFLGSSLFSVEQGQRGMEYLLSLPYSRYKLIGLKILPRLFAVLIFFLVFLILYTSIGKDVTAISYITFALIYFSLFLIALSFSSSSDNFLVLFVVSLFSLFIYLGLLFLVFWVALQIKGLPYYELDLSPFITGEIDPYLAGLIMPAALVMILPLLLSFILSFKKFDIRPSKVYNKRYFKFFTPLFILCLIISYLFAYQDIDFEYNSYYLTQDHKLIVSIYYSDLKIYDSKKVHKIKGESDFWWPFLEENEYVYDSSDRKITRYNTSNYTSEVLYEVSQERVVIGWQIWKYDQTIAFLTRKRDYSGRKLVLLDETSRKVTKIPIDRKPLSDYYNRRIFGTDKIDGKQFWLIGAWRFREEKQIFRLWDDGRIEKIQKSQRWPYYINRLLITYTEEEIIISKEKEGRFEAISKIPNSKGFSFGLGYYPRTNLNNIPIKELYGWKRKKGPNGWEYSLEYARLDLENFQIEELGKAKGWLVCFGPDDCYLEEVDHDALTVKIYELKEGKLKHLKTFKDLDASEMENRINIFKAGVIVKRGKKIKAYAFPDLKPLKFKKL